MFFLSCLFLFFVGGNINFQNALEKWPWNFNLDVPEIRGFPFLSLPFEVRSCEVAIIWPGVIHFGAVCSNLCGITEPSHCFSSAKALMWKNKQKLVDTLEVRLVETSLKKNSMNGWKNVWNADIIWNCNMYIIVHVIAFLVQEGCLISENMILNWYSPKHVTKGTWNKIMVFIQKEFLNILLAMILFAMCNFIKAYWQP